MEAKQTPLIELLERIPQDARLVVEHDQFSSSVHPVGKLCREAAAALRAALEQPEQEPVAWIDYIVKEAHEKYDLATSRAAFQAGAIFVQRLLNTSPEFMDCVITKRSNRGNQ